jgi:DNA-binding MarR family transcriptional regulator
MTPTSQDTLFLELAHACSKSRRCFDRYTGMTQARRQLLSVLAEEGEISHAELQGHLGVDGAAITRLVKSLESQGVVRRRLDPRDNRFTLASLTASGADLVAELRSAHRRFQATLLAGVSTEEQETVVRVLKQLRANILDVRPQAVHPPVTTSEGQPP